MNSRDLCTIAFIPEFINANMDAFKIEGRMRHPHYTEIVSKVYREAIDAHYLGNFTEKKINKWVTELKKVYNRGFTPGFYFKRMTENDHQHRSPTNLSHYRYIRVGKVIDSNNKYATILLNNGYISKNDDLIIMGKFTDTYLHQNAKEILYNGNVVNRTPRGTKKENVMIQLGINGKVEGNGKDIVYIFTNKTYKKKKYSL